MKVFYRNQKVYHPKLGRGIVQRLKHNDTMGWVDFNGKGKWFRADNQIIKHSLNSYEVSADDVIRVANKYKDLAVKVQQIQSDLLKEKNELLAKDEVKDFDLVRADEKQKLIEKLELILQGKL